MSENKYRGLLGDDGYVDYDGILHLIEENDRLKEHMLSANKQLEALWDRLDGWDMCMDDYSMHYPDDGLDEEYARKDGVGIILKELYSYTEEDGWQKKEPASE